MLPPLPPPPCRSEVERPDIFQYISPPIQLLIMESFRFFFFFFLGRSSFLFVFLAKRNGREPFVIASGWNSLAPFWPGVKMMKGFIIKSLGNAHELCVKYLLPIFVQLKTLGLKPL